MSGGCCSPLPAPPATHIFYQTVESNAVAEPQRDALNFSSAFSVADNAGADRTDVLGVGGFHALYYVDPTFTGTHLGSESNPFASITAAFAAAAALAITAGVIVLAPGTTTVENVVFPTSGQWEIRTPYAGQDFTTTIQGTITFNSTATCYHSLTNMNVSGAVSGNMTGGTLSTLFFTGVSFLSTITLTNASASHWQVFFDGKVNPAFGFGGFVQGAVSVAGAIFAWAMLFVGSIAIASTSRLTRCILQNSSVVNLSGNNTLSLLNGSGTSGGVLNVTVTAGTLALIIDPDALFNLLVTGLTVGAGVTVNAKNAAGNASTIQTLGGNVAATQLAARTPRSLMVAEATVTVTTPSGGTGVGVITPNVQYTDVNGTVQTKALIDQSTGLAMAVPVNSAAGTEAGGRFTFSQNGATTINFSVTGVTTAGALQYSLAFAVRQAN